MDFWDHVTLMRDKTANARLGNKDGTNLRLLLTEEERSSLFALFENQTWTDIYGDDSASNDSTRPSYVPSGESPDCTDEDLDIQTICQALEITSGRAFGGAYLSGPKTFSFSAPTNLSIETARMLITLNDFRLRIRAEGTPVGSVVED